jgi:hypothetical protein
VTYVYGLKCFSIEYIRSHEDALSDMLRCYIQGEIVVESCFAQLYCGIECALFYMSNHSQEYYKYSFIQSTKIRGINHNWAVLQDRTARVKRALKCQCEQDIGF